MNISKETIMKFTGNDSCYAKDLFNHQELVIHPQVEESDQATPFLGNITGKRCFAFDYDSDEEEFPGIACGSSNFRRETLEKLKDVTHKNGDIRDNRLFNLESK